MQQFDLDQLCFIASSEIVSKAFIQSLKQAWLDLDQQKVEKNSNWQERVASKTHQLTYFLDMLNQPTLIGGVSYEQFQNLANHQSLDHVIFDSNLPALDEWIFCEKTVQELYQKDLAFYVGSTSISVFRNELFFQLDTKIRSWILTLKRYKKFLKFKR